MDELNIVNQGGVPRLPPLRSGLG